MKNQKNANEIKKLLKNELGIESKLVRSRLDSTSLNVELKTFALDSEKVRSFLCEKFEDIDYCGSSGEILQGGNFFVFVNYSIDAEIPQKFIEAARSIQINFGEGFTPIVHKISNGARILSELCGLSLMQAKSIMTNLINSDETVRQNFNEA
jgi:hypothetical protein